MANIEITQRDKLHIAEFVFALECDTLTELEVYKCIKSLCNSKIINQNEFDIAQAWMIKDKTRVLLQLGDYLLRISNEQGDLIMKEYYAGKL